MNPNKYIDEDFFLYFEEPILSCEFILGMQRYMILMQNQRFFQMQSDTNVSNVTACC